MFKGTCKLRGSNTYIDVAMKMLQPVQPGANARQSAIIAYKVRTVHNMTQSLATNQYKHQISGHFVVSAR